MSINPPAGPVPSQPGPPYPAARPGPARAHVRRLRQDGSTYRGIPPAAGLAPATAARKRAIAGNWCAGAALDDDLLDIPGYRPRHGWKPATGTGVAPDVRPRTRRHRRNRR